MLPSRGLAAFGGVLCAGAALAWVLPPTTPHGGPTVGDLARSPSLASDPSRSFWDTGPGPTDLAETARAPEPVPVSYDPTLPRLSLMNRGTETSDGSFATAEREGQQAETDWATADERNSRRSFRRGYRHAAHAGLTDPNACADLPSWSEEDGCLAYVSEAGQRDEADGTYDP